MEIPPAERFVELLSLRGKEYAGTTLEGILGAVYDFAAVVWQSQAMYSFVKHGIEHSFRVGERAVHILHTVCPAEYKPSSLELLVLGIASLIHDVGMQYEHFPKPGEILAPSEVRKQHTTLGYEMVSEAMAGTFAERGGPLLPQTEQYRFFVQWGASVGFAHSGRVFWDKLKSSTFVQTIEGGEQLLRPRFLAAVFRIADELDTEYTRMTHVEFLGSPILTDEEVAHWLACYYARSMEFSSPGVNALRLVLHWRIGESASAEEEQIVRTLLEDLRERKTNAELALVDDYLRWDERAAPCVITFKLAKSPERVPGIREVPERVKRFVQERFPYQFKLKPPPQLGGMHELAGAAGVDSIKYVAQQFIQSGAGALSGHFRLKTKWHTNKYIQCRELCSNLQFVVGLTRYLQERYAGLAITDVIAIGTSALRIASELSFSLGARLSYTFGGGDAHGGLAGGPGYTEYEREWVVAPGGRVLVVDDILGVGSVIRDVVTVLQSKYSPMKTHAFCIYSLGDVKELASGLTGVEIDFLVSQPDVRYLKEDPAGETCDICREDPGILRVEE